jgi:flagellar biosynthetic protein FliR
VRLFVAVATTLAIAPLALPKVEVAVGASALPPTIFRLILSETIIGGLIGLMGRAFFLALQFMGVSVAMYMGYGNTPDAHIEETDPTPAVTTLVTLTATVLFFLADLHWEVLRALLESYTAVPISQAIAVDFGLSKLADALSGSFMLALKISAPFVVYTLIINMMFGIVNKLVPQIPVYFISVPFVLAGGLFLLYFAFGEFLRLFLAGFRGWLIAG